MIHFIFQMKNYVIENIYKNLNGVVDIFYYHIVIQY